MRPFGPEPLIEIKSIFLSLANFFAYGEAIILLFFFVTVCFIDFKLFFVSIIFGSATLFLSISDLP